MSGKCEDWELEGGCAYLNVGSDNGNGNLGEYDVDDEDHEDDVDPAELDSDAGEFDPD